MSDDNRVFPDEMLKNLRPLDEAPREWQSAYLGAFSHQMDAAHWLWVWYHHQTERFDQHACQARDKHGTAIPVTPRERALCNNNARQAQRIMHRAADFLNIRSDELRDSKVTRDWKFEHLSEIVERIDPAVKAALDRAASEVFAQNAGQPRLVRPPI